MPSRLSHRGGAFVVGVRALVDPGPAQSSFLLWVCGQPRARAHTPHNQDQASLENAIVCITDFLSPVLCWQTPMLILLGTVSSAVMNVGMQPSLWYANLPSFRELPEVGLGHMVALILVF